MQNITDMPKSIIKSELSRRNMHVKDLVELLKAQGEILSVRSFNTKMSRKTFSAVFFMKCLIALNVKEIKIGY